MEKFGVENIELLVNSNEMMTSPQSYLAVSYDDAERKDIEFF